MTAGGRFGGVMICGAGHSGSTLLGFLMGSLPGAFYVGEGGKVRYLHDEKKPLRKRVCKLCGEDCPVWPKFYWSPDAPEGLYSQVAAHVSASLIVDSTKDPAWIEARSDELRREGGVPRLIFLSRDGRAVANSRIRKYPERDPEVQIRDWMAQIERSQALFDRFDGLKIAVRYEDLATDPEAALRTICDALDLDFDPAMLDYRAREHHPLGGNSGTQHLAAKARFDDPDEAFVSLNSRTRDYYLGHSGAIALDLRWRSEMSADHVALFERVAGEINTPFKWESPVDDENRSGVPTDRRTHA